jgi:3-phenylpropionate/trans-cinnamate dioxygenase ferredoxin subunit
MVMNWIRIACAPDLQDDEVLGLTVGGARIALCHGQSEFYATDNRCTHAEALMSEGYLEDGCIERPLPQARFDIRTDAALCAPATEPLRTHPVKREGDKIFIGAPAP